MLGESLQPDGMLALMKWEEETPYIYFFKHGLDEEKVVSILADWLLFHFWLLRVNHVIYDMNLQGLVFAMAKSINGYNWQTV